VAVGRWGPKGKAAAGIVAVGCLGLLVWRVALWQPAPRGPRTIISSRPLVLSTPAENAAQLRASVRAANILIIVMDAARADHLGCYGYPRNTTPNVDRLAAESLLFERHYTDYPQTKTSTASLFTSRHADTHLATEMQEIAADTFAMQRGLKHAGLTTAYFYSNAWASPWGFAEGFDDIYSPNSGAAWRDPTRAPASAEVHRIGPNTEAVLAAFSGWLASRAGDRFFAYVHLTPPHFPYDAPKEMAALFTGRAPNYRRGRSPFPEAKDAGGPGPHHHPGSDLVNKYDANLRYADWAVGRIVDELRKRGLLDKTLLLVTSDHGESFGEHGYNWHPACPFEEALHIPMLIRFPGGRPAGRVSALTENTDLLPTIYDLLALPLPTQLIQGRSFLPLISSEKAAIHQYLFSHTGGLLPCYVVRDLRYALLLYEGGKLRALYDLDNDPWQMRNIIDRQSERAARMADAFRQFALTQRTTPLQFVDANARPRAVPRGKNVTLTEETKKQLRTLGYVQ